MKELEYTAPQMELLVLLGHDVITESWELPVIPADPDDEDWELPLVPPQ